MSLDIALVAAFNNILSQLRKILLDAREFCGILSGQLERERAAMIRKLSHQTRQKKRSNNESGRLVVWTATKRAPATNNQL
jgi:hypothetical protein